MQSSADPGRSAPQHIRAAHIDAAVGEAFLITPAPAELDALSRSRRVQQQMNNALRSSTEPRALAQAVHATLAERQFNRADLDSRLVASELELRRGSGI